MRLLPQVSYNKINLSWRYLNLLKITVKRSLCRRSLKMIWNARRGGAQLKIQKKLSASVRETKRLMRKSYQLLGKSLQINLKKSPKKQRNKLITQITHAKKTKYLMIPAPSPITRRHRRTTTLRSRKTESRPESWTSSSIKILIGPSKKWESWESFSV